jgi:hypothetical protein
MVSARSSPSVNTVSRVRLGAGGMIDAERFAVWVRIERGRARP